MIPVTTTFANQPTTSHLSWRSTLETWAAPVVDAGELAEAEEAVAAAVAVAAAGWAAERHAGEDGLKR